MDFIFMLTRSDRTVEDALEVLAEVLPLGLTHIGFKDVGVPRETMSELVARIRDAGAVSYLEVVSTGVATCVRSAEIAAEIGFDRLLGGIDLEPMLAAEWDAMRARLAGIAHAPDALRAVLARAGAPTSAAELGWPEALFRDAGSHARFIRGRFTFLDLAAELGIPAFAG